MGLENIVAVIWYPDRELPLESTISLLHKFMFWNSAGIKETQALLGVRFTETGSGNDYGRVIRVEEEVRVRLRKAIGSKIADFDELPSRKWKLTAQEGQASLIGMSRVCPHCVRLGYHSSWHELAALKRCFIHGCELVETCSSCHVNLSPRLSSPNKCPNAHVILSSPESHNSVTKLREKILTNSRRLMVWHDQTFAKTIEEGLIFRTSKKAVPIEGSSQKFIRKDDVRNWHLSDEGLIGISSKLYGTGRNVALRGSADGFQVRKETYITKNLQFDLERWRKDHLRPLDRFTTGNEKIAKVTRILETAMMNYLYALIEEYDREIFTEHAPCESAQAVSLQYRGLVDWPVFCVFGLVRMAIKEAWIYQKGAYYEDEIEVGRGRYRLEMHLPILKRMGHIFHISNYISGHDHSRDDITDFVEWLTCLRLRDEVQDYHDELFRDYRRQLSKQDFHLTKLFDSGKKTDRAWILRNCAKGIQLVRVDREGCVEENSRLSKDSGTHVEAISAYYENEIQNFEKWLSNSVQTTSRHYREFLDNQYDVSSEDILKRIKGSSNLRTWIHQGRPTARPA